MGRHWIVAPALAVAAMVLWVGSAFADAGPHNISSLTSNCAGCHSTHTATAAKLLRYSNSYELCISCHGSGASVDVVDGTENSTTNGVTTVDGFLKGGGFISAPMNATNAATYAYPPTDPTTIAANSKHAVVGMPGFASGPTGTLWGIGPISGTANGGYADFALECTTCHDPHGKSGPGKTPTYRILRSDLTSRVVNSSGTTLVTTAPVAVPDTTGHKYTISSANGVYYGQTYSKTNDTTGTGTGADSLLPTLSDWCATCHTRIHATGTDPGSTTSGDAVFTYRHATGGSATDMNFGTTNTTPSGAPACLTCHVVHGSSARITSNSAQKFPWPGGSTPMGTDSLLLRLNQRGVCEACHNK